MKTLIILTAIPASGKSTWANNYAESHDNVKIISSDAIRIELTGSYNNYSRQKEVWETFSNRIKEYSSIDGVTVILDALNDLNSLRQKYVKENPEYDKYVLVMFTTSINNSIYYNSLRDGNRVPDDVLKQLQAKFEPLNKETEDLFDEIYKFSWENNETIRIK